MRPAIPDSDVDDRFRISWHVTLRAHVGADANCMRFAHVRGNAAKRVSPIDSPSVGVTSVDSVSRRHERPGDTGEARGMARTMDTTTAPSRGVAPIRPVRRRGPRVLQFYGSGVGKKWVMAITGVALMGFVVFHMVGNLKLFLSKEELNLYGEALRDIPGHLLPRTVFLWTFRIGLIVAFVLHIHAAASLTIMNRKARPQAYKSPRDYVAADFASRTMRWTGIIVLLFVIFHLMDLTWGNANDDFVRGDPYNNLVYSMQRVPVAIVYILANVALAVHLYHGSWSLFQSLGLNNPRYNPLRRQFAIGFALLILVGNLTFPVAVQLGLVEPACPHTDPVAACNEESGLDT
jgi:succinate dehydrogenase / fumarate reductase, cytochrome b subunit